MKRKDGYKCIGKYGKVCDECKNYLEQHMRLYDHPEEFIWEEDKEKI